MHIKITGKKFWFIVILLGLLIEYIYLIGSALLPLSQYCSEPEYPMNIGGNYYVDYSANDMCFIGEIDSFGRTLGAMGVTIWDEVVAWNYDSIFIIAKQKPFDDIMDSMRSKYGELTYDKSRKLYNESKIYHYWIIDKREELERYYDKNTKKLIYPKGLYGPFTYDEYWKKRKEFNVSDSLTLRKTDKRFFDSPFESRLYYKTNSPRDSIVE
jgi:hypothetical protein